MIDLELSYSWAGGTAPLHLYWDYEADEELIGVVIERKQVVGGSVRTDFRSADNAAWLATPKVIQTKDYSLTIPPHWAKPEQTECYICVRLIFTAQQEHQAEIRIGG